MSHVAVSQEAFRSHRQKYDELEKLFAASGNYGSYRATLRSSEMPTVPLLRESSHRQSPVFVLNGNRLGVLARDIYATNELASLVELSPQSGNFVINVSSYRIIAKTVRGEKQLEFFSPQIYTNGTWRVAMELCHVPYKFRSFEYLQAWLDHALHDFMDPENEGAILREFDERRCQFVLTTALCWHSSFLVVYFSNQGKRTHRRCRLHLWEFTTMHFDSSLILIATYYTTK